MRTQGGEELRILFSKVGRVCEGGTSSDGATKFRTSSKGRENFQTHREGEQQNLLGASSMQGGVQNVRRGENFLAFPEAGNENFE